MSSRSVFLASGQAEDTRGIAKRVAQISVSPIKQMPLLAAKIGGCISLGQGIPSIPTPEFIRERVIEQLRSDAALGKYSLQPGVPALRAAIARHLEREKEISVVDPESEVFVSCGGMEALAAALCTIVDRGDEVILLSPNYSSHIEQVLFAEGVPVFAPLNEENNWALDPKVIASKITARTKAILICNPMNPTGAVFDEAVLREVAKIALAHNLMVIADETYDFLTYDGRPFFSLASIPELKDSLIATYSFSKKYCMTGWRVGYAYAPSRLIEQMLKVHDAFAICAPTISQYAALAALEGTSGENSPGVQSTRHLHQTLEKRRNLICGKLDALPDLFSYQKPAGAYYIFPKIIPTRWSSMELALKLLNEAKVITVPGNAFGPTGEGHIRMSFGGPEADIEEAFSRINAWWAKNQ